MGLSIYELDKSDELQEGDEIIIDPENGEITDITTSKKYTFNPIPPFMQELVEAGGLIEYAKLQMKKGA
jgi:3-isopropylmalate/(R)-2-methylmalate dehydratase small subunit